MKIPTLQLVDDNPELIQAWHLEFSKHEEVMVAKGDYFDFPADCLVSPANSFGYMDGGIDRVIAYELGHDIEKRVQEAITEHFHGEMPVGCSIVLKTGHQRWPMLVVAPTMRLPQSIKGTINAYLSFRSILLTVSKYNLRNANPIETLSCCGLGTGIGQLDPFVCAKQMRIAWDQVSSNGAVATPAEIHRQYEELLNPKP